MSLTGCNGTGFLKAVARGLQTHDQPVAQKREPVFRYQRCEYVGNVESCVSY